MNPRLKTFTPAVLLLLLFLTVLVAGCVTPSADPLVLQKDITENAAAEIESTIQKTMSNVEDTAKEIAASSKDGVIDTYLAKQAIANLYQKNHIALQTIVWDRNGKIITTYPDNKIVRQNETVSEFSNLVSLDSNGVSLIPYMTNPLGQKVLAINAPIKQGDNLLGSVTFSFDPYDIFSGAGQLVKTYGTNLVVIQKDGTQIYDADIWELGTNLLTDSRFKEVLPKMQKVLSEEQGVEKYMFYEDFGMKKVEKTIVWKTISNGGQELVVATTAVRGMPKEAKPTSIPAPTKPILKPNLTNKEVAKFAADEIMSRLQSSTNDIRFAVNTIAAGSINNVQDKYTTKQALATLYQRNDLACQLFSMDASGNFVAAYPENIYTEQKFTNGDELKGIFASLGDSVYLSNYSEGSSGKKYIVTLLEIKQTSSLLGYLAFEYDPYDLFSDVQQLVKEYGLNLVVIQKDGTQIYDVDVWELGTNLLTDTRFAVALPTMEKVLTEVEGEGTYEFFEDGGREMVTKNIAWTNLNFGGKSWVVAVTGKKS